MPRMLTLARTAALLACGVLVGSSVTKTTTTAKFQGKPIEMATLKNSHGMEVQAINYGAIIPSIKVPDRSGKIADVVLGFDQPAGYWADPPPPFFGAVVGRYGNRIAKGQFAIAGKTYKLATNNAPNHLHGGNRGFDKVVWDMQNTKADEPTLSISYLGKNNEEGYPGNLQVNVKFSLTDDDGLQIEYDATTDQSTPVN